MISSANDRFEISSPSQIKDRMLTELQASMGEIAEDLLPELAAMLLEDAPKSFSSLQEAIRDGNAPRVKEVAHTFKGSCASMGIGVLAAHFQEIENLGRNNQLEAALYKIDQAMAEYEQVKEVLNEYLP